MPDESDSCLNPSVFEKTSKREGLSNSGLFSCPHITSENNRAMPSNIDLYFIIIFKIQVTIYCKANISLNNTELKNILNFSEYQVKRMQFSVKYYLYILNRMFVASSKQELKPMQAIMLLAFC